MHKVDVGGATVPNEQSQNVACCVNSVLVLFARLGKCCNCLRDERGCRVLSFTWKLQEYFSHDLCLCIQLCQALREHLLSRIAEVLLRSCRFA